MEIRVMGIPSKDQFPEGIPEMWEALIGETLPTVSSEEAVEKRQAVRDGNFVVATKSVISKLKEIQRPDIAALVGSLATSPRLVFPKEFCKVAS